MSQALTLPDELMDRLRRIAEQQGLSVEQLLAQWSTARTPSIGEHETPVQEEELLVACTRALLDGAEPPVAVDWNDIQSALQASEPIYATIEEAMSALRQRSWSKEE